MTVKGSSTTSKTKAPEDVEETKSVLTALRDAMDKINGFEELAILEAFSHDIWDAYDAALTDGGTRAALRLGRMIGFANLLREGSQPNVAYDTVLAMNSKQVDEILAEPKDAEAAGKDESTTSV